MSQSSRSNSIHSAAVRRVKLVRERTAATMRFSKVLPASLAAVGLIGCSNAAGLSDSGSAASSAPGSSAKAQPAAAQAGPAEPHAKSGARAAAVRFDGLYLAGHLAASWDQLVPEVKRQIPLRLWIRVHHACHPASTADTRVIKAVTVFGNAAIVTEAISTGRPRNRTVEEVFSYVNGRWGFSPGDLSIYHHRSAFTDVAAARNAGYCATWKTF